MSVETGWVRAPRPIRGLDHLGVQAPCIAIYGELLPGITNVTDRARYFSFYPWLLIEFDRRYADKSRGSLARVLRRAECLVSLVASWHEHATQQAPEDHGRATIGRQTLHALVQRIVDGERIELDDYVTLEDVSTRYFKNPLGGLAQYYYGPLRDLRIVDWVGDGTKGLIGYDKKHAVRLAEAFGAGVDSDRFFDVLESDSVGVEELASAVAFCPCGLRSNPPEQATISDLFFGRVQPWSDEWGATRRTSLGLLLALVRSGSFPTGWSLEALLRGSTYSGHLADGSEWRLPEAASRLRVAWGTYQRNELLSLALQGLFWAGLRATAEQRGGRFGSVADFGQLVWDLIAETVSDWSAATVADAVSVLTDKLPAKASFTEEGHEVARGYVLAERGGVRHPTFDDARAVAVESITVFGALLARGLRDYPYAEVDIDPAYFGDDDPHLLSLRQHSEEWQDWPVQRWVKWLATRWGLERHLHVALRKLRAQGQDTFRVRPLDGTYAMVEAPPPVFTAPRMTQAVQILRDLGLLKETDDAWSLTDAGQSAWELCRGG